MATREIPFRPNLEGDFRARFYSTVSAIDRNASQSTIESICASEIDWVENQCVVNIVQRRKYRAVWYLFRDLVRASWKAEFKDGILYMRLSEVGTADNPGSTKEAKDLIRSWMSESRHERVVASSDFVSRVETPSATKKAVTELIADGTELAARLSKVNDGILPVTEAIKPYLQLVTDSGPGSVDTFTNQRIADIWRYFRMTWATPAENTPGRTMQYLIRDAAHPMHAVMGLASLENCAVAISCRDEYLGWTQSAMNDSIRNGSISALTAYHKLIAYLIEGINSIDYSDLCDEFDIQNPSSSIIDKLNSIANDAENQRKTLIANGEAPSDDSSENEGDVARSDRSVHLLFKHKRADQLAKNLSALVVLRQVIARPNFTIDWEKIGEEEAVGTAIRIALTVQKSKHIGTSMLELNVCGAIPPYNEVLGGKLVALLATSPQVIHDYKVRYGGRRSEIASKLKGSDICRPADLVYIGTTSLYSIGSSQYNRLKIPQNALGAGMDIKWEQLGYTTGYGTLHISKATTLCLKEAMGDNDKINHVFGEGPSPKMRLLVASIRELLETTSDDTKEFTKHAMSRIVYGAKLACNTSAYLLGYDSAPEFYMDVEDYTIGTERIIRFWQERWLAHRINYVPIFERLLAFDKNSIVVGNEIQRDEVWHFERLSEQTEQPVTVSSTGRLQFIRDFYRGKSAFADGVQADDLKSIHVPTKLDKAIFDAVSSGRDVVLTGNPGDGKTHIIRMLEKQLLSAETKCEIELDASTKSNEQLFESWRTARAQAKVFVIAINAAVLHSLYHSHKDFKPISEAYLQMIHAVNHGEDIPCGDDVVVFDLSKREVLTAEIIDAVISKLTDAEHFAECAACPLKSACPVEKNRQLIRTQLFKDRILAIAQRAILRGYHATLRDLQAFVSFLIFGDRDCGTIVKTTGNNKYDVSNLVYTGKGKLFDAFRASFDPISMSHPVLDEMILTNSVDSSSWIPEFSAPVEAIDAYNQDEFALRKRQFYFFNQNGSQLIDILDDDISQFQNFLSMPDVKIARDVVSKLNMFFGKADLSKELEIWSGHRFNNAPRKVLISSGSIKTGKFVVGHPKLLPSMTAGIEMSENYVRLYPKDNSGVFLKIDFAMYSFLSAAEHGIPVLYMDSVMTKRVWRFIEQLQYLVETEDDTIELALFDIQNKTEYKVEISLDEKKFTSISREAQRK